MRKPRPPKRADRDKVLAALWTAKERDVTFYYPDRPDGHWLYGWLFHARTYPGALEYDVREKGWPHERPSFIDELKERGYDVETLKLTVSIDPKHPRWKPAEEPTQ